MNTTTAVLIAITFTWLGMVLAISFIEAPLKFRAPNVTLPIGLGIGRMVFRALNTVEAVFAIIIVAMAATNAPATDTLCALIIAVAALMIQLMFVRPRLNRRSDLVLAGADVPRSGAHHVYVGLETVKVIALAVGGVLLLAG